MLLEKWLGSWVTTTWKGLERGGSGLPSLPPHFSQRLEVATHPWCLWAKSQPGLLLLTQMKASSCRVQRTLRDHLGKSHHVPLSPEPDVDECSPAVFSLR